MTELWMNTENEEPPLCLAPSCLLSTFTAAFMSCWTNTVFVYTTTALLTKFGCMATVWWTYEACRVENHVTDNTVLWRIMDCPSLPSLVNKTPFWLMFPCRQNSFWLWFSNKTDKDGLIFFNPPSVILHYLQGVKVWNKEQLHLKRVGGRVLFCLCHYLMTGNAANPPKQ